MVCLQQVIVITECAMFFTVACMGGQLMACYLRAIVRVSLVIVLLQISALAAEHSKLVPAAPVPPQIVGAKKVFVANAGGDERWYEKPIFSGGPSRAYDQFYAAMKNAGRYEIVNSPAEAELIFEIGLTAPMVSVRGDYDPQFRLAIRDPKTNTLLWAFTEHVQLAVLKEVRDNNFDQTMEKIIGDLQGLSASSNNAQKP
jgi:hypothetical protein